MEKVLAQDLSGCGLRLTRRRVAVLDLLRSSARHLTVLEIFRLIRQGQPRVRKKTIYEVLDLLVRIGFALCLSL